MHFCPGFAPLKCKFTGVFLVYPPDLTVEHSSSWGQLSEQRPQSSSILSPVAHQEANLPALVQLVWLTPW